MGGRSSHRLVAAGSICLASTAGFAGEIRGSLDCDDRCGDFVIHVEGISGSWDGAGRVVELGQKNRVFVPHVVALLAGSTLRVGNDDPFMHNVHARLDGETVFNFNVLFQYQTVDQVITEPGLYRVSCEPHPEMSAILMALENPFFTQPDAEGRYSIAEVPPGSYELVRLDVETERRRTRRMQVGGGVTPVDF